VSRCPVLIPVAGGVVGAVVDEPLVPRRGSAVLFQGAGSQRFGPNQIWGQVADDFAGMGLATLRMDYPGKGESIGLPAHAREDAAAEAVAWFRKRTGGSDLLVLGSCAGARLGANLASGDAAVRGLGLLVPTLWRPSRMLTRVRPIGRLTYRIAKRIGLRQPLRANPEWIHLLRSVRAPVWILAGEGDRSARVADAIQTSVGSRVEIETVPGLAVHTYGTPRAQQETRERVRRWATRALDSTGS
jgi:alpha-beta hydrolase superfamily lysophospholipase